MTQQGSTGPAQLPGSRYQNISAQQDPDPVTVALICCNEDSCKIPGWDCQATCSS